MRHLPPLNSLKAFESVARHLSFSRAAEELGVTQSAISKQIRLLEEYLLVPLFYRKHQHIELTDQAYSYYAALQSLFDKLEQETDRMMGGHKRTESLRLNILPSLSSCWLIPKLEDFKQHYPNIAVSIDIGDGTVDFNTNGADIAIRVAQHNQWERYTTEVVMEEELVPVCAPELGDVTMESIQDKPLLQHTTRPNMWHDYFHSIGLTNESLEYHLGFEHFYMLIQAACDGMGVALVPKALVVRELEKGTLGIPFEAEFENTYRYYLIAPQHKAELRKCRLFTKWLLEKA
ncbi:MAG: LysR substrate-binding domain-containing protein [Rickettsiales bacterium]|nr:LysR substrate-binding domain-containing protein [Rickettsiales bacterium]